jgi:hypothetical protein
MLRALLEDRFHLVAQFGPQPMRASALIAGPHPQLKLTDPNARAGCGYFRPHPGQDSIFDARSKELGLKLESQKQPMPVLVVDHIEQ